MSCTFDEARGPGRLGNIRRQDALASDTRPCTHTTVGVTLLRFVPIATKFVRQREMSRWDRAAIPQIRSPRSLALDQPRQSAPRYLPTVTNRRTIRGVRCHPLRIRERLHRRAMRWTGSIPINDLARGAQIPIAAAPADVSSRAVSLYGLCQGGGVSTGDRSAHIFLRQFLCSI
jgi:hypothetical protein